MTSHAVARIELSSPGGGSTPRLSGLEPTHTTSPGPLQLWQPDPSFDLDTLTLLIGLDTAPRHIEIGVSEAAGIVHAKAIAGARSELQIVDASKLDLHR